MKYVQKTIMVPATVCGFTIGLAIGAWFLAYYEPSTPWQAGWMELFFWVFPAAGAGLGMGFAQWSLIRHVHKHAYLWILATTIGVIVIVGGALLVFTVTNYYRLGTLSWLFSELPRGFVPLAVITPIIIFIGPFSQWLIVRYVLKGQSFKELLKISLGWISSIIILFIMLGLVATLVQSRNDILNLLVAALATIPSGLIFAYSTIGITKNSLIESRSL